MIIFNGFLLGLALFLQESYGAVELRDVVLLFVEVLFHLQDFFLEVFGLGLELGAHAGLQLDDLFMDSGQGIALFLDCSNMVFDFGLVDTHLLLDQVKVAVHVVYFVEHFGLGDFCERVNLPQLIEYVVLNGRFLLQFLQQVLSFIKSTLHLLKKQLLRAALLFQLPSSFDSWLSELQNNLPNSSLELEPIQSLSCLNSHLGVLFERLVHLTVCFVLLFRILGRSVGHTAFASLRCAASRLG